jgi:hypothetical protein
VLWLSCRRVKPEINPSRDREIMHIVQKGALQGGLVGVLWCHQQGRDDMTTFAFFANGTYWGTWDGECAQQALCACVADVGTDMNQDGLEAFPVDQDMVDALQDWAEADCPAGQCPIAA